VLVVSLFGYTRGPPGSCRHESRHTNAELIYINTFLNQLSNSSATTSLRHSSAYTIDLIRNKTPLQHKNNIYLATKTTHYHPGQA